MLETCAKCRKKGTPWAFDEELNGHICTDCYRYKVYKAKINALWMRIKTAPKDGSLIDIWIKSPPKTCRINHGVCDAHYRCGRMTGVFWTPCKVLYNNGFIKMPPNIDGHWAFNEKDERGDCDVELVILDDGQKITHWMPSPTKPSMRN